MTQSCRLLTCTEATTSSDLLLDQTRTGAIRKSSEILVSNRAVSTRPISVQVVTQSYIISSSIHYVQHPPLHRLLLAPPLLARSRSPTPDLTPTMLHPRPCHLPYWTKATFYHRLLVKLSPPHLSTRPLRLVLIAQHQSRLQQLEKILLSRVRTISSRFD